ncbi:MAG: flagellar biosynthesis protein FlhF [Steroidobacteraceae bacterium]|nr:flagellar biosynthesis protein FlhF [Steroidobacteraceae bacterium]
MKISKYTARDMRQALRLVREQLGPDAVIVSTKRLKGGGVEVTAAMDFDVGQLEAQATAAPVRAEARERAESASAASADEAYAAAVESFADSYARVQAAARAAASDDAELDEDSEKDAMRSELRNLRRILETQLAHLAWNDLTRRAPTHTEILRELTEVGLTQDFAAQIVAQLPSGADLTLARRLSMSLIAQRLPVTGDRWLDTGGRVALIGSTGVGKTTSLAKLAVRWVLRHGTRSLALICADAVRIGAHDQIHALGQMLDVPVYTVENYAELPKLLETLAQRRFVLIDTPGSSQRDTQLAGRLAQLAGAGSNIETALVLSACTQAGAIEETVKRFAPAKPASCLITKVDEAASLGGVLSVLTRADLPISYVSEGQRVPEDLRPARALELVSSAVKLAKTSGAAADEDLLRRRYGDIAHALA